MGPRRVGPDDRLSIVEHLHELRGRLIVSIVALVLAFLGLYLVHESLLEWLQTPLPDSHNQGKLVTLSPTEPFFTVLKVCFWCAVIVAFPVWLYQLYAFVIPAVTIQSRRITLIVVAAVSTLFLAGVAFGFFVVLPVALDFLLGFGGDQFATEVRAEPYFSFVTTLLLGSGLMFEVPAAMVTLSRMGIVDAELYVSQWRVAVVVIAVIAAILPGGDPLSMLLLMAPQLVLYALGVVLARRFGRPALWRRGEDDPDQAPPQDPEQPGAAGVSP